MLKQPHDCSMIGMLQSSWKEPQVIENHSAQGRGRRHGLFLFSHWGLRHDMGARELFELPVSKNRS